MKVLVTCDPAESHEDVFQHVVAHAWPPDTSFVVLAVVLPLPAPMPHVADQLEQQAAELVENLASCFRQRGLEATGMVRHGYPRLVVVTEAADLKADLVILGGPRTPAKGIHLPVGSVTRTVLRSAHCSVDIARPRASKPHEGNRVLVATDGSEDSLAAVRFIAGRPWTKDTVFEVVSVAEGAGIPVAGFYPGFLAASEMEYLNDAAETSAEGAVAQGEQILRAAGLNVAERIAIPSGTPNDRILREAERWAADLIVVGSHGARGFRQFLIGSVSESVAMHAACSVEVHRTA
jgi:nucleotide-binding universal stress UspA family protein